MYIQNQNLKQNNELKNVLLNKKNEPFYKLAYMTVHFFYSAALYRYALYSNRFIVIVMHYIVMKNYCNAHYFSVL
jgi:hypothetical protein